MGRLRSLTLTGANVTEGTIAGSLSPALGQLSHLQWLELKSPTLHGSLPPTLSALTALQWLGMPSCALSGEIPDLRTLTSLTALGLSGNRLYGSLPALPASIQDVYLATNELSGTIPAEYGSLPNLRTLWLVILFVCSFAQ